MPASDIIIGQVHPWTRFFQPSIIYGWGKAFNFERSKINGAPFRTVEPFCEIASAA